MGAVQQKEFNIQRRIQIAYLDETLRIARFLPSEELADDDKAIVARARRVQRFLTQPFFVAEVFTGSPGKYVSLKDTIKGFKMIVSGECDALPEQAFYMIGAIEEAVEKAKSLQ